MIETIKRHIISAGVTFASILWLSILAAVMQLDKWAALTTYLAAWSLVWFVTVCARAFVKVLFESLVPAVQAAIPSLIELFNSFIDWAKNLNSQNK